MLISSSAVSFSVKFWSRKDGAPPFSISQAATNLSVATLCTETHAGLNTLDQNSWCRRLQWALYELMHRWLRSWGHDAIIKRFSKDNKYRLLPSHWDALGQSRWLDCMKWTSSQRLIQSASSAGNENVGTTPTFIDASQHLRLSAWTSLRWSSTLTTVN